MGRGRHRPPCSDAHGDVTRRRCRHRGARGDTSAGRAHFAAARGGNAATSAARPRAAQPRPRHREPRSGIGETPPPVLAPSSAGNVRRARAALPRPAELVGAGRAAAAARKSAAAGRVRSRRLSRPAGSMYQGPARCLCSALPALRRAPAAASPPLWPRRPPALGPAAPRAAAGAASPRAGGCREGVGGARSRTAGRDRGAWGRGPDLPEPSRAPRWLVSALRCLRASAV